jgi:hypothetical protein
MPSEGPGRIHPTGLPTVTERLPDAAITKGVASGTTGIHIGVYGSSESNNGVYAESKDATGQSPALYATGGKSAGLYATGTPAAHFEGDVEINGKLTLAGPLAGSHEIQGDLVLFGDIRFASAADCAEDFTICADLGVDAGTVVVLGAEGALFPSRTAYDKRVVGVVSGAGECKPGIILDRKPTADNRQPVALVGKVYCKVDASHGPVDVGDLLTTSSTPGHAMRATDPLRAFGAVIGKALQQLKNGRGLIPVLVALQ